MDVKSFTLILTASLGIVQNSFAVNACGNGAQYFTANVGPGSNPNTPDQSAGDPVIPYTGNEYKVIKDLEFWGGVGNQKLEWTRYANSRAVSGELFGQGHYWRHHYQWDCIPSVKTVVVNGSPVQTREFTIVTPSGTRWLFTAAGNSFVGQGGCPGVLISTMGLVGSWYIETLVYRDQDGNQYSFLKDNPLDSYPVLLRSIKDPQGNIFNLEYVAGALTKITEPGGRWISIGYKTYSIQQHVDLKPEKVINWRTLATAKTVPAPGAWVDLSISAGFAGYKYARLLAADGSHLNVADVDFFEAPFVPKIIGSGGSGGGGGGAVGGIAFPSGDQKKYGLQIRPYPFISCDPNPPEFYVYQDPVYGPRTRRVYDPLSDGPIVYHPIISSLPVGVSAEPLFDNKQQTAVGTVSQSGEWIGYDIGGVASYLYPSMVVGAGYLNRVRFRMKVGTESSVLPSGFGMQPIRVQGGYETAPLVSGLVASTVISHVETSDGRRVDYEYDNIQDALSTYIVLTGAIYGDGTRSTYRYGQIFDSTRPLVVEYDDARYNLPMAWSKTQYQNVLTGGAVGMVSNQFHPETGVPILTIGIENGGLHSPTVTYGNGAVETQYFGNGQMTAQSDANAYRISYTYGVNGFLTGQTDALGNKTTFVRSEFGNVLSKTNPDGTIETWTRNLLDSPTQYTDALGRVTTWTRDINNRVSRIDYPDGSFEEFAYNGFAQVTLHRARNASVDTFTYDQTGLLTSKTDSLGNTTSFGYDSADRPSRFTDALGRVTLIEYNERGLLTKITNPDSSIVSKTYNRLGDVIAETNELGATWSYQYDVFRRITAKTDPLGRTTSIVYPNNTFENAPLEIKSPSGRTVTFGYDLAWHKISETVALGTTEDATQRVTYDKNYRVLTVTDALGKILKSTYNKRGWKLTETDPLARITSFIYDLAGNVLTVTRPDAAKESSTYDSMNRVLSSIDAAGKITKYTYDIGGTLHDLTDARGSVYSYIYDSLNRKTRMLYPDGSREDWVYDAVGNGIQYVTRNGQTLISVYDSRNREISSTWSDSTPSVTRVYDLAGRLLKAGNSVSELSYTYDTANQLLSETQLLSEQNVPRVVSYQYDADGNRARMVAPSGMGLDYSYTSRNQIAEITADGPPSIVTYGYDLNGSRVLRSLENGTATNFAYDAARQLTSIEHVSSGVNVSRSAYIYDKLGNRTAQTWEDGRIDTYGYDKVNQLTKAVYAPQVATSARPASVVRTVGYTYDAVGNRSNVSDTAKQTPASYTVNGLNQYTAVDGAAVQYDGNGNLKYQAGFTYEYDAQNRLLKVSGAGSVVTFSYDSRNRCVARRVNGAATYLVYDGWTLLEERGMGGELLARYIQGLGTDEPIAMMRAGRATVYYHQDGLGSVTALTGQDGSVVESYQYDVFGKALILDNLGAIKSQSVVGNRFMYTGREWLAEAGLYDYRNRVYSAQLGRFLQSDPIRFAGGDANIYRYVKNAVLGAIDPDGLDALFLVGRNNSNPSYFSDKAKSAASAYESANPGQKATVSEVRSLADVSKALSDTSNVDRLDYWGHGGPGGLFLGDAGAGVYPGNISQLPTENLNEGAEINLVSCNSALGGKDSIAQAFADHFQTPVSGFTSGVSFGLTLTTILGDLTVLGNFPRGDAQTRTPGQTCAGKSTPTFPFGLSGGSH